MNENLLLENAITAKSDIPIAVNDDAGENPFVEETVFLDMSGFTSSAPVPVSVADVGSTVEEL